MKKSLFQILKWHLCTTNKQRDNGKSQDLITKIEIIRWNASIFTASKKNSKHIKTERRFRTKFFKNTSKYLDLLSKYIFIIWAQQDK